MLPLFRKKHPLEYSTLVAPLKSPSIFHKTKEKDYKKIKHINKNKSIDKSTLSHLMYRKFSSYSHA